MINILLFITVFLIPFYFIRFDILSIPTNIFEVAVLLLLVVFVTQNLKPKTQNSKTLIYYSLFVILFFLSFLIGASKAGFSLDSLGIVKSYLIVPVIFAYLIGEHYHPASPKELRGASRSILQIQADEKRNSLILQPKTQNLKPIFLGLYVSLLVVSLWAILQRLDVINTLFYQIGDASFNQYLGENFRAFGPFESPNYLAMFIVPILYLTIGTNLKFKIYNLKLWNVIFYLSLILPLIALVLTKSRAGLIALVVSVSLLVIFWLYKKLKSKVAKVSLVIFSFILYSLFFILLLKFGLRPETDSARLEIYSYSWQMIKQNPIWGVGLGNYQEYLSTIGVSDSFREIVLPYAYHPHNLFMGLWLNLGILGLLSFVAFVLYLLINTTKFLYLSLAKNADKNLDNSNNVFSTILFAVSIIAVLIHGIFDTTYFKNDLSAIFWLAVILTAYSFSDHETYKSKTK